MSGLGASKEHTARVLDRALRTMQAAPLGDPFQLYGACRIAMECLAAVDTFYVALVRPAQQLTAFPYTFDGGAAQGTEVLPYGERGLTAWLLASRKTYRYSDDDGVLVNRGYAVGDAEERSRDAIVTPLLTSTGDVTGFLAVLSARARAFADEHVFAMEWLARALMVFRQADESISREAALVLRSELGPTVVDGADTLTGVSEGLYSLHEDLVQLAKEREEEPQLGVMLRELAARCLALETKLNERQFAHTSGEAIRVKALTSREMQLARLIASNPNQSTRELAALLGLSEATIKSHVSNLLQKLAIRQRGEVRWALRAAGFGS